MRGLGREPNVASNNGDSEMHLPRRGSREHESKHDDKVGPPSPTKFTNLASRKPGAQGRFRGRCLPKTLASSPRLFPGLVPLNPSFFSLDCGSYAFHFLQQTSPTEVARLRDTTPGRAVACGAPFSPNAERPVGKRTEKSCCNKKKTCYITHRQGGSSERTQHLRQGDTECAEATGSAGRRALINIIV